MNGKIIYKNLIAETYLQEFLGDGLPVGSNMMVQ
jgi:hypothetical protein